MVRRVDGADGGRARRARPLARPHRSSRYAVKFGVLGAGVMGGGIAQVCALAGDEVVCYDIAPAALDDARAHVTTGRFG
ncbi:MAG TPA: 3-hydroxyacyl-CoA dehydrogenase NAD-binding domain-containing protein, partial [Acidimicrobiia bacterium]|nr:3-hydroxyacyl-CoA dehydrogenase NAD-binding domain-containing protein [Acidimicrobiia bacterium]